MQPTVRSESARMLSFLALSDTCKSRAKRYADGLAYIRMFGHPAYIPLFGHPYKPDLPYVKQTLHALMLTDSMGEIERARLKYASCAGKGRSSTKP